MKLSLISYLNKCPLDGNVLQAAIKEKQAAKTEKPAKKTTKKTK